MAVGPEVLKKAWEDKYFPLRDSLMLELDKKLQNLKADQISSNKIELTLNYSEDLPKVIKKQIEEAYVAAGWKKVSVKFVVEEQVTSDQIPTSNLVVEFTYPTEQKIGE